MSSESSFRPRKNLHKRRTLHSPPPEDERDLREYLEDTKAEVDAHLDVLENTGGHLETRLDRARSELRVFVKDYKEQVSKRLRLLEEDEAKEKENTERIASLLEGLDAHLATVKRMSMSAKGDSGLATSLSRSNIVPQGIGGSALQGPTASTAPDTEGSSAIINDDPIDETSQYELLATVRNVLSHDSKAGRLGNTDGL